MACPTSAWGSLFAEFRAFCHCPLKSSVTGSFFQSCSLRLSRRITNYHHFTADSWVSYAGLFFFLCSSVVEPEELFSLTLHGVSLTFTLVPSNYMAACIHLKTIPSHSCHTPWCSSAPSQRNPTMTGEGPGNNDFVHPVVHWLFSEGEAWKHFQMHLNAVLNLYEQAGSKQTMSKMLARIRFTNCTLYLPPNGNPKQPNQVKWKLTVFCLQWLWSIHVLNTELQEQITGVKLMLDRMLPADYFWQVCKFPLAYQKWRRALEIAVAPLHSLWVGLSPAGTQSYFCAANGLGAGWGHGSDGAITEHLTYVKNQAGKHPRFCICSSERGNGLKKEEVWQRNVFNPLGNSG